MNTMSRDLIKRITPTPLLDLAEKYFYFLPDYSHRRLRLIYKLLFWSIYTALNKEISFATPDGTRFVSMPQNFSSLVVYIRNFRDPAIQTFMERNLKKSAVFVDAGANVGTYSVRASTLIGSKGKVIAIEAHPFTYTYLLRNIAINKLTNIEPIQVALGSKQGAINIAYTETNAGETHIAMDNKEGISVPMRTLDDILSEHGVSSVDYIKIDVEGFEYQLLLGAQRTLAVSENVIVQTELNATHASRYGRSIKDTSELLSSFGLSPHYINADGTSRLADLSKHEAEDALWWREGSL